MSEIVKGVYVDCKATNVDEALDFLADKAVECGISSDKDAILNAYKAREEMGSTGMMSGFAIPHAKTDAVSEPSCLVVKFAGDVAWKSQDGQPITCAISLLTPDADEHLLLLARLARHLLHETFRNDIASYTDPEQIRTRVEGALEK